jgi:hypothetical protein
MSDYPRLHETDRLFDVPNLDCLSVDAADMRAAATVLHLLGWYAECLAREMELNAAGHVQEAASWARQMDETYDLLPRWARW